MKDVTTLAADNIRILAASMVEKSKSGHPGGAMGGADFINILYTEFLKYNPDDPTYPLRDRFFLDPGTCRRCSIRCWRWPAILRSTSSRISASGAARPRVIPSVT